jgi:hypothetical protein
LRHAEPSCEFCLDLSLGTHFAFLSGRFIARKEFSVTIQPSRASSAVKAAADLSFLQPFPAVKAAKNADTGAISQAARDGLSQSALRGKSK